MKKICAARVVPRRHARTQRDSCWRARADRRRITRSNLTAAAQRVIAGINVLGECEAIAGWRAPM
jgi:hypothetical protein